MGEVSSPAHPEGFREPEGVLGLLGGFGLALWQISGVWVEGW